MNEQSSINKNSNESADAGGNPDLHLDQELMLENVLSDFRASVHSWSEAAYIGRALVLSPVSRPTLGQRSLVWALSLVLSAGVASTGIFEYHQRELVRQAAARQEAARARVLDQQQAREVDDLLAKVDSDVAREVPSAMEPLTGLMPEDETQ